ncbi:MAG: LamG domain-containing protein [Candidatus Aenigmatarchaeota archaeon]
MKAITPVISLIMLMLITVGIVGIAYVWFSGIVTSNTEKVVIIPVGGVYCQNNKIYATIINSGSTANLTDDDMIFVDINGVNAKNSLFFGNFDRSGLVGYWRFEQSSGSAATNDSSGYGNMGTLKNMNLIGDATSGPTQGRFGNALLFDGVDDYVLAYDLPSLDPASITVGLWLYLASDPNCDAGNNWRSLLHKGSTAGTFTGYDIVLEEGRNIAWDTGTASPDRWWPNGISIPIGTWTYLVLTYDSTTGVKRAYQNGVLKDTKAVTALPLMSNANNLMINNPSVFCPGGDGNFKGIIDEVMIWDRVLQPDEITQLNKTNSGNFTIGSLQGITIIKGYSVSSKGKYTVEIGTRNGVSERTVECL